MASLGGSFVKRTLYGLLLVFLVLTLAAPVFAAPNVTMTAQGAFGARARQGGWVTVIVDLSNQGGELDAELVVESADNPGQEHAQYVVPLTLPAGAAKRISVDVQALNFGDLSVSLRSGGKVLQQSDIRISYVAPDSMLVGVLSDDELGIPAISQMQQAQVVRLDAGSFPARAALLDTFDALAISRFDMSKLSKDQLQALEAWVGKGGTLLLAGGPEWQRTFKPLPASLVPVNVTGAKEVDLQPLGALVGSPLNGKAPVSDGKAVRGRVLLASGETPLLVQDQVGAGAVIYQAFDPGLDPVVKWQGQSALYTRLISVHLQPDQFQQGNPEMAMQQALQQIPGLGVPSPGLLGGLLVGYMLLVGPLNYWVLKRYDRREWSWVTVPLLSAAFVAAVYGVGFSKQISMLSHVITVTELSPGTKAGTMTSYVGVYAPARDQVEIPLENAKLVRPLMLNFSGGAGQTVTARIVAAEKTRVDLLGLNNYSMRGFAMEQDVTVQGSLDLLDVAVTDTGALTARVVNHLDRPVQGVQVALNGNWQIVGDLAPGASSQPVTVSLASANPKMNGGMGFRTVQFTGDSLDAMDQQRRYNVLNAIFGWEGTVMRSGSLVVTGWTDQPMADPKLPEMGRLTQGANLVYATLPVPIDLSTGDIPAGLITGIRTGGAGFGRSPFGYSLSQGNHTFQLTLPPFDPARVAEVNLHLSVMGNNGAWKVQAKNQKTGEWVELQAVERQALPNWHDLVGATGLLELNVDVGQYLEMAPPTISVKGVGR
jgi:hypothetical protein